METGWEAVASLLEATRDRHVTYTPSPILPGFLVAALDCPPYLVHPSGDMRYNPDTMQLLLYTPDIDGFQVQASTGNLFVLKSSGLMEEDLDREPDFTDDKGNAVYAYKGDPFEFTIEAVPVVMKGENGEDVQCSMMHLLYGLALHDAQEQGPDEVRRVMGIFSRGGTDALNNEIDSHRPETQSNAAISLYQMPTNKTVSQGVFEPDAWGPLGCAFDVSGPSEKKKGTSVKSFIRLWPDENPMLVDVPASMTPIAMTPFDLAVYRAISSQWAAGNHNLTLGQVGRVTYGMYGSEGGLKSAQLDKVYRSFAKMRTTNVTIDLTQEARGRNLKASDGSDATLKRTGHLIEATEITLETANGILDDAAFQVLAAPVLYEMSAQLKQVAGLPIEMLSVPGLRCTETNIAIREALLMRIGIMHGHSTMSGVRNITTAYIYEQAGVDTADRDAKKRARNCAEKCLDYWSSEGYIAGYTVNRGNKNAVVSYTINIIKGLKS